MKKAYSKIVMCLMVFSLAVTFVSRSAYAAQQKVTMFNFDTFTTATHTSNSATGTFLAVQKPGATAEPMCNICVTALDHNGQVISTVPVEGTYSTTATITVVNVGGCSVRSYFLGVFCAMVLG